MSTRLRSRLRDLRWAYAPRPAADVPDGELVTRFALARDEEAFAELVRRHGPMVLATCRRVLHPDTHTADDAFQAAFLVLATKAAAVRPPGRVGAFLYGVAVRVARKARAWARRVAPSAPSDLDRVPAAAAEPDPDAADLRLAIDDVLAGLPARYRAAVVLCDLEGASRAEAALALGWSEGTLSGRLARARKLLADRLARRGFGLPAAGLAVAVLARPAAAIVPAHLAASTLKAAALVAAGAAGAEVASGPVTALAREGVPSMTATSKLFAAGLAGVGLALAGLGLYASTAADPPKPAPAGPPKPAPVPVVAYAPVPQEKPKVWVVAHTFPFKNPLTAVAFGKDLVAAGDEEGVLVLLDTKTGKEKGTLLVEGGAKPIDRVQVSADGDWLYLVTSGGGSICQVSADTEDRSFAGFGGGGVWKAFGTTPDGGHWLLAFGETTELCLVANDIADSVGKPGEKVDARFKHESAIKYAAVGGKGVIVSITAQTLRAWETGKDKPLWEKKLGQIDVTGVVVSPDGKLVAVTGDAGQVWVFDAKTGKQLVETGEVNGWVAAVAFSPDGKRIAVAGMDKTAHVYDTESGKESAALKGHTAAVTAIAFSPDGKRITTGSADKTVKVWELK